MTPHAAEMSPAEPGPVAPEEQGTPGEAVVHVEDTTEADVADDTANEAVDDLIDLTEADPVVPGEPLQGRDDA